MKFARVGAVVAAAAIVVTACGGAGGGGKAIKIGITLPLSGSALASAGPAEKGAQLAIKEFKLDGYTITVDVKDHAVNGVHDPQHIFSSFTPRPVESCVPKRHHCEPTQVFTVRIALP